MLGSPVPPARNTPPDVRSAPFLVTPDPGAVDTAYENAGIVNLRADRGPSFAGGVPALLRKLTHFRAPGMGDAMWSGSCVYDLAGKSPSLSSYDGPDGLAGDDGLTYSIQGGLARGGDRLQLKEPTITRQSRIGAQFDSAPAASFFQGAFNARWSGMFAGYFHPVPTRAMHQNFNPNQKGSKELHKATQYKPVPPMGSLVGYFGSNDKAV